MENSKMQDEKKKEAIYFLYCYQHFFVNIYNG